VDIELTQGKNAAIDDADRPLAAGYSWRALRCNGKLYAQTKERGANSSI